MTPNPSYMDSPPKRKKLTDRLAVRMLEAEVIGLENFPRGQKTTLFRCQISLQPSSAMREQLL